MQWYATPQSQRESANITQQQKNAGGSGGGSSGRSRAPLNDYGERAYTQQSYLQPQVQQLQGQNQVTPAAVQDDPYAACTITHFERMMFIY